MRPSLVRPRLAALGLVTLLIGLLAAACAPAPTPANAPAPAVSTSAAPARTTPAAPGQVVGTQADTALGAQDAGPSLAKSPAAASTRHFKGNPDAPVVVIEISDFQ